MMTQTIPIELDAMIVLLFEAQKIVDHANSQRKTLGSVVQDMFQDMALQTNEMTANSERCSNLSCSLFANHQGPCIPKD